jgi:transcriptional regulator with XRE-family HTH domain
MNAMNLTQLKDMMRLYGLKPLAEKANVSRTSLYNFLSGENFEGETLQKVTRVLDVELGVVSKIPSLDNVYNHLAYYGAPILYDNNQQIAMSLEETIKWGLKYSKTEGLLESVMPFFILTHFSSINKIKLFSNLDDESLFQLLGFYLDLTSTYSKNKMIEDLSNSLFQKKFPVIFLGIEKPSERAINVFKAKSNPISQKWNVFTFNSLDDYFDRFKKWS